MRPIIFSDTFPPEINGVATSSGTLYDAFKKNGEEIMVCTTNPYGNEMCLDGDFLRLPGFKMKMYDYRIAGLFSPNAKKIIMKFKPDVIHIQTDAGIGQFGFLLAKQLGVPVVYTFHTALEDYTYYATRGYLDRVAKGIVRSYVRYKSSVATEFITPSVKTKEYMRSIGVDSYINVIPTGIDFSKFAKENVDQEKVKEIKKEHGISDDTFVILSLGRVAKEKSIDICLKGYAKYLKTSPKRKTVFVIVGGGPAFDELNKLVEELGIANNVKFFGPVKPTETPLYYQVGDLFVSASITETQGLTFMEAMASSVLLMARYDDTLLSTINDGKNGFFFLDEDDMAKKLNFVINMDEKDKERVRNAAIEGLSDYSIDKFYERVKHVYERAIKRDW